MRALVILFGAQEWGWHESSVLQLMRGTSIVLFRHAGVQQPFYAMTREWSADHAAPRRVPIRVAETINRSGAGPSSRTGQHVVNVSVAVGVENNAGVAADTTRRVATRQMDSTPFTYVSTVS